MCEYFLHEFPVLVAIKSTVKRQYTTAPFETVPRHLELVHRMNILHMHLDARAVGRFSGPHIQIFMPPCLEVERIVTIVQVSQLR